MLLVLICIAIPVFVLALIAFMRSQYGDELFGLDWPPHELNRDDDYRLIKMRFNSAVPETDAATSEPSLSPRPENERF